MAPLTKDSLEIANPAGESVVSQRGTQVKPDSGHLRSDAVSLEVSVRVHGSKVKDIVLGTTPHTEPFEEQTITMIIFPQGAVLKMLTPVNVGQMLVLTNLKSRQDAICRVVKVRPNANLAAYVEVEFTHRQPGYWGAAFPSDGPETADKVTPAPTDAAPKVAEVQKPVQDISWAPAPPPGGPALKPQDASTVSNELKSNTVLPKTLAPPAKAEPSFISIGSQEEVQPAASATATIKPGSLRESAQENFAPFVPKNPTASEIPPAGPASPVISELLGDADSALLPSIAALDTSIAHEQELSQAAASASSPESPRSTFGSFSGGTNLAANRSSSSDIFGSSQDSSEDVLGSPSAAPRQNWILIAASVGVLAVVLAGGYFFLRSHSANKSHAATIPEVAPALQSVPGAQPSAPPNSAQAPMADVGQAPAANAPVNAVAPLTATAAPTVAANATTATKPLKTVTEATPPPAAATKQAVPKVTPDMMSQSLNAHPTASQRANASSTDAPAIEDDSAPAPSQTNALPGIGSSTNMPALPPPTVQQEGPVRIGGDVKEPRLISSAKPVYPIAAIQAGIEGDVVIQTTIDKTGKVADMHVVSGSPMLRQAALEALRRWKYEPSTLNGQPVDVQMQVTIKFRR